MRNKSMFMMFAGLLSVLLLITSTGCSMLGYSIGSSLPPGIKTVCVPIFTNESGEPQLETEATVACIQEVQRDGSLKIADISSADSILKVTITKLTLSPVRYDRDNVTTANEYLLRIDGNMVLTKSKTGEEIVKKSVYGEKAFQTLGDTPSSKRAAIPDAVKNLAHDIVKSAAEAW